MRFAVLADAHIGRSIPLAVAEQRREAFSRAFSKAVDAIVGPYVPVMIKTATRETRHGCRTPDIYHLLSEARERTKAGKEDEGLTYYAVKIAYEYIL